MGIGYLSFQSTLPVLENPFSKKVRSIVDMLQVQRSRYMKVKMLAPIHSFKSPSLLVEQVMPGNAAILNLFFLIS